MTTFTVWKFEDPEGAKRAASLLKNAEEEGLVNIVDHAVMSWPVGAGKPDIHHGHDDPKSGAAWGALWGMLIGALFAIPLVGGIAGAALGALAKSTEGAGIKKADLEKIRTQITEGTSALFLVTEFGEPRPPRRAVPGHRAHVDQHQPDRRRARHPAGGLRRQVSRAASSDQGEARTSANREHRTLQGAGERGATA